jgi:ParB family chromosome partitioning protein
MMESARLWKPMRSASANKVAESRGLGRGLGALIGAAPTVSLSRGGGTLPIALMQPGAFQPRAEIQQEPLKELAASIKANGVIQPIIVRRLPQGAGAAIYEIVAGERRWQAAKLAGLSDIPCIVRELTDQEAVAVALIENIQREDLSAAEEARALKRLVEEFSLTQQEVATIVGRSRAAVSNLMRLLELPQSLVAMIDSKILSMGHARALLGLEGAAVRERVADAIVSRGLSVRDTEKLVRQVIAGDQGAVSGRRSELAVVSEVLRTSSVQVQLQQKASGAARIVVDVADGDTRDAVLAGIRGAVGSKKAAGSERTG